MTKYVRVATGYSQVPLPDGRTYNQGPTIALTDAQYASLPNYILQQIVLVSSAPDPASSGPPTPSSSYTTAMLAEEFGNLGVPLYLTWNGSDYVPSNLKAATNRLKVFVGPTDPSGFPGVQLQTRDQWINA